MKNILFITLAVLAIPLFGCEGPSIKTVRETAIPESSVVATNNVQIQNGQMTPDTISINVGEEIVFTNLDKQTHIIASDPHPEHSELPDLYSPPLYQNKSYKYLPKGEGSFGVHLEENPSIKAQVIVISPGGEKK